METGRSYVRFAALGDSVTYGLGDRASERTRGWARLLGAAIGGDHHVSFCNLAQPGATVAEVRDRQLSEALDHRPHLAALIVGLNDTMRSAWDVAAVREALLYTARRLAGQRALLLTVRFHDHSRVFGLPGFLARPMRRRIDDLNTIYAEIHTTYGGVQVDLAGHPGIYDREFWSIDRLHPSEHGHRALAHEFSALLEQHGLTQAAPWLGRRARDLGPWAARRAVSEVRARVISRLPVDAQAGVQRLAA